MTERLRRAQPVSIANHVKARQSLIQRAATWLATETGWARRKRSAICSGKLCGGFIIFEQCCTAAPVIIYHNHQNCLITEKDRTRLFIFSAHLSTVHDSSAKTMRFKHMVTTEHYQEAPCCWTSNSPVSLGLWLRQVAETLLILKYPHR